MSDWNHGNAHLLRGLARELVLLASEIFFDWQAWASGAMFPILCSVLGMHPSAPHKELNIINPQLPDWIDHLRIRNLRIGANRVGLDFSRRGDRTFRNVVDVEGDKLLVNVAFKK